MSNKGVIWKKMSYTEQTEEAEELYERQNDNIK